MKIESLYSFSFQFRVITRRIHLVSLLIYVVLRVKNMICKMPVPEETLSISDVIVQLQDYSPTIPDSITTAICSEAGFETSDPRIIRLISIASQKFISDIANDALQHCRVRLATLPTKSGKVPKDRKFTLTMEDLTPALNDYGIVVRKPPYFV